jgi:hypothetical protein
MLAQVAEKACGGRLMAAEKRFPRNVGLKPRKSGDLPPEKLKQILSSIYPEETADELMEKLCKTSEGETDGKARTLD